jgi:hypothetical protein
MAWRGISGGRLSGADGVRKGLTEITEKFPQGWDFTEM